MRLALITTQWDSPAREGYYYPSLGICYIATYIKEHLPDVDIIVIDGCIEDPLKKITEKIDLVGISSTSLEFLNAIEIASKIKSFSQVPIILGGVHISALPQTLPKYFDIGVISEGEQTMLELTKLYLQYHKFPNNELKKIRGIVFHNANDRVIVTEQRPFIKPIDIIPHPDLDLFNMEYYLKPRQHLPGMFGRGVHIITSRGCPYKCVFCGGTQFWKIVRFHSPHYVVEEIRNLIDKYNVDCINILDDLFMISKKRLVEIVKLIKEERINEKVKFGCQMRADMLNDKTAKLLKDMNMVYLGFGLESGSEKILSYLKKGTVTVEENKKGIGIANKYSFKTGSGFMIGSPNETMEDIEKTYNFILDNPLDGMGIYITTPLPGTELWYYIKQKGIVSDNMDWSQINQFFYDTDKVLNDMNIEEFKKVLHKLRFAASISSLRRRDLSSFIYRLGLSIAAYSRDNPEYIPLYLSVFKDFLEKIIKRRS